MNISLEGRLYKVGVIVYLGYTLVKVHEQRGRFFIHYRGRQINLKEIPVLPVEKDCVFDYIFEGGFRNYPCPAMDYWIYRWRLKIVISIEKYIDKFNVKRVSFPLRT